MDPGMDAAPTVAEVVAEHRLKPIAVLLTHGHLDHTFSVTPLCADYASSAWIHSLDRELLVDPLKAMSDDTRRLLAQFGLPEKMTEPDDVHELTDGVRISLAGIDLRVDHAPGHTKGSVLFRTPYPHDDDVDELVFSGDVLFAGSIGRTDLPGGSPADMLESLRTKVAALPDSAVVLPGHGPQTHHRPGTGDQPLSAVRLLDVGGQEQSVSRPRPLSGFPEYTPEQRIVEQHVLDRLRETFELHGFSSIETRAVEPLDRLAKQGEIDKEVYVVRRLHAADDAKDELGLHFDLTVPFARYVLENAHALPLPFRRYQIQKVWRGERPQEGRFREFTQADIDIVDAGSLAAHHDVELPLVTLAALERLHVDLGIPPVLMRVNNRRLAQGFYRGLDIADPAEVLRQVDKIDKIGPARVGETLVEQVGLTRAQADACVRLAGISSDDESFVDQVRALGRDGRRTGRGAGAAGRRGPHRPAAMSLAAWSRTSRSPAAWTTTPAPSTRPSSSATRAGGRCPRAVDTSHWRRMAGRLIPVSGCRSG